MTRLVATDVDGTLLRSDASISTATAALLHRLTAAGTHVVLVTARPLRWLSTVYEQLPAPLPAVCSNGAVVYDPGTDTVLRAEAFAPAQLGKVCAQLRESIPDAVFAVEVSDGRVMRHESAYPLPDWDANHHAVRPTGSLDELCARPAVKLLARAGRRDVDEYTRLVSSLVDGFAEATHSSRSPLVELSTVGVTKAAGLAWLCDRLGVPAADVLAFGDMPNDVPMLRWAGRSVAVGNAHPAAKAAAHEVTRSNDEDGVAHYLAGCG